MLLEDHGLHVRQVHHHVDQGELGLGELLGHRLDGRRLGEAHRHHHLGAAPGHVAERLLAHGRVGDLEIAVLDAGVRRELLGAVERGLVERFVELAAHVEDDGRHEVLCLGRAGHGNPDRRKRGDDESFHEESPLGLGAPPGCIKLSLRRSRMSVSEPYSAASALALSAFSRVSSTGTGLETMSRTGQCALTACWSFSSVSSSADETTRTVPRSF